MKKLLVLVALTMVMFTGCGSEKNTEVVDVKESAPAVVTESEVVDRGPAIIVSATNGAVATEMLFADTTDAAFTSFIDNYMVDLCEAYDLSAANDFEAVRDIVVLLVNEAYSLVEEDLKSLTDMEEVAAVLNSKLEEYVTMEKIVTYEDFVIRNLTSISGSSTPVATATPAPVVPEEPSKVEYRDAVDADVTEWLASHEASLPDTLDNITIIGVCLSDLNNRIVEVYFTDSTGTGYAYTAYGLQLCKPDFAEKFSLPGCHLVVYNG